MNQAPGRRRAAGPLLAVLLLHAGLLALLWTSLRTPPSRAPALPAVTAAAAIQWLRLQPVEPTQQRPTAQPAQRVPALPPAAAPPLRPHATLPEPQAITLPAPTGSSPANPAGPSRSSPATQAEPPTAAASAPEAARPLNLALPPPRAASQPPAALTRDDPRVRERLDYGQRMARSLGTDDQLRESVQPDGTRRFQRGTGCVLARTARAAELDPFNQSVRPIPRGISPC